MDIGIYCKFIFVTHAKNLEDTHGAYQDYKLSYILSFTQKLH